MSVVVVWNVQARGSDAVRNRHVVVSCSSTVLSGASQSAVELNPDLVRSNEVVAMRP